MEYSDVLLIVEGWHDHDQLQLAYPGIQTLVIYGTRVNKIILNVIQKALTNGKRVFVMTDPDTTGDWSANAIQKVFNQVPRITIDPNKSKSLGHKGWHYGVEYCSVSYLKEVLDPILSGDYSSLTFYLKVLDEFLPWEA